MFIQTEQTPNPDTLKFLPGQEVAGDAGPFDFANAASAGVSRLAQALFDLGQVERVFLGAAFISISKAETADWACRLPMQGPTPAQANPPATRRVMRVKPLKS